ncbi:MULTISPECIES: DUF551 domain-containing protein [Citrobacter]|uniref:DUF551 domain-containing protein n=1 Tax=Citrobacter TaxID=544 RepID=UPI00336BF5C9
MKWVAVTESMPKPTGLFTYFIVKTEHGVGFAHYDNIYGFGGVTLSGPVQHSSCIVSHWMPMPQDPVE